MAVCYVAVAVVLGFGYVSDQSTCLWQRLTGSPCPGCGMGHALLALARGDVSAAWSFNRGSIVVAPLLLWSYIKKTREFTE